VLVVLSNAVEGKDEAFNAWYTDTHLKDLLKIPGYEAAQRFRQSDTQLGNAANLPYQYLAIYEVETDDLPAAANAMTSTPMYIDPSLDRANTVAWYYTSITERKSR
jgi:hypothetical protein